MIEYIVEEKQTSLAREQKQAVGLLSIGTFLEYFDLMLYVHMAVLLNELFFPKTDPHIASLLSAAAFCSTYALRPIGAYIFGKIGDNIGRKQTVIITTLMMSLSCVTMATLPTYAQIGIASAWIITICRIVQGISSLGELIGVQVYLTEMTKPPIQYPVVASTSLFAAIGSTSALGVATLFSSFGFNWRIAFWIGAGIALVGTYARATLRETPEFANAKLRMQRILEKAKKDPKILDNNPIIQEKVNKETIVSLFFMYTSYPIFFYLTYIHFGSFLKNTFNYSGEEVIFHNFLVGILYLIGTVTQTYLSYIVNPLKILRIRVMIFTVFLFCYPYLLANITNPVQLLIFQACLMTFSPNGFPAIAILYKYFPIFKRFTCVGLVYALSQALMNIVTSFGLIYLVKYFGQLGVLFIVIPVHIGFIIGLRHFEKLERQAKDRQYKELEMIPAV